MLEGSLADRLKSLGVVVGGAAIAPRPEPVPNEIRSQGIERTVPGDVVFTPYGEAYVVTNVYETNWQHGLYPLMMRTPPEIIAAWAGEEEIARCHPETFTFLDIETTGISASTGTYAFLISAARIVDGKFVVKQFFLRSPGEEIGQLAALQSFLFGTRVLVTFNGKAFDAPVLATRFGMQALGNPLHDYYHLDLLHLARRLWKERLPSRTLIDLEVQILDIQRDQEDIPSWIIPQLYMDYLQTGDARLIKNVFYHNLVDTLSMATLLNHVCSLLENPLSRPETPSIDLFGIARLHESLGHEKTAVALYESAIRQGDLPPGVSGQAMERLSFIYKRGEDWESACRLWEIAAAQHHIYAHVELAKYFEHRRVDIPAALDWTENALLLLPQANISFQDRYRWQADLLHRRERLQRKKQNRKSVNEEP